MKTDKLSHSSGKGKKKSNKSEHFDDVDKRIQIPMATRMKMQMNLKMNSASASACASSSSSEDTRLLRSGIDQYRSLQHLNTSTANPRRARGSAERAAERGVALMERKQFGAAVPYFTEALDAMTASASELGATNMGTVKLYHQRGLCYLAAHKYKPAIEDLSKVMQMTPKSAELYAKRGKAYAALGEHHAAMLDYNEAISLAATQGLLHDRGGMSMESDGLTSTFAGGASLVQLRGLYLARAKVYKSMNNIAHALEDLGHAESSAGGHRDLELFYERAQLYLQCHQDSLALQDFDRYLELQEEAYESRHFDASGGVGGLAGFGAPQEMEAEPKARMLDVLLERAKLLQRMALEEDARERKDVELAAVEQGQGAKKTPKAGKGGSKLAYTSVPPKPEPYRGIESRRLEKRALHDYSRAIELESSNVETFRLRGEAFMHLARYEEALADFASALELDPHDFQVCMARAKLFRQRGDLKGAVQEVTAVLRVNGFFINGLKLRAQLYEELGAIQDAEKDYSSIIHAHFDKPGIEDAAASGKVSMELASGGTLNLGGHGGKSSNASGKNGKAGSSGKITSEVAAQALLCRARLRLASEQFDAAEEDYSAILKSFANNMEAQLELQETQERRIAFEERKQREAVAWLEQNADEMDGAGVLNVNATSGKSKKKKKKKKKKNSSSSTANANSNGKPQAPAGYVLLVDEEELQQQQQQQGEEQQRIQLQRGQEQKEKQSGLEDEKKDRREEMPASPPDVPEPDQETKDTGAESSVNIEANEQQDTKSAVASPEENVLSDKIDRHEAPPAKADQVDGSSQEIVANHEQSAAPVATPPPSIVVANVMTRDEAWESMWDEEADEPLEAGAVRIRIRAQSTSDMVEDRMTGDEPSREDETSTGEMEKSSMVEDENHAGNLEDAPTNGDDEANDEASGSSDDGKDSQGKAKAVLVDEKYLKKREKQLKKLRASLQHASDERDKSAIDEALARAERKQMSDALQDDIQRARDVLADMAAETQRLREALPPAGPASNSATGSEHGRMHLHTVTPTNSPSSATPGASKPPSLVIRPIAYGQALQAAEQHQQQLRAHQKLLEEKDAEIAQLKKLLAQKEQAPADPTPQEDARSLDARAHAKAAALSRRVARLRTQFPVQSAAARQADALIEWMGPSDAADRVRQQVLSFVQRVITAHFPLAAAPLFFATGSYPMKTYLPGSDLDICLLVPQELESSWYFIVTQALCIAGGSGGAGTVLDVGNAGGSVDGSGSSSPSGPAVGSGSSGALLLTNTVRNVTFINADVRVVKCTVDNIPVDFTANRVGALGAVRLLDAMAVRVGRQHLFKKSLILIKAWCTHESSPFMQAASVESGGGLGPSVVPGSTPTSVMGASHGALSTYAVNTIVMALFNQHGDALTHPLQALYLFLDRLAEFPWHEAALTLHGAVPLSRLATTPLNGSTPSKSKLKAAKLDAGDVEAIRDTLSDQFGAFDAGLRSGKSAPTSLFPIRACNIVDPLDDKNNLARSVSAEGFPVMKRAFRLARDQLAAMLAPRSSHKDDDAELLSEETGNDVGMAFFSRCWQLYGRGDGWRPDLLIHPRQIWHGKAASTSSSGSAKKGKASPRPRAASSSPVQQNSDEDEDRRWESLLPKLDAGAVNALLLQHQQLQQQAAAAAAYHGAMIAYQQPYYQQQQQQHGPPMGSPGAAGPVVVANGVAAGPGAVVAEQGPYYQPTLRRPYGSPGASQRSKSPPPRNVGPQNGKTPMGGRRFDSSSPQRS